MRGGAREHRSTARAHAGPARRRRARRAPPLRDREEIEGPWRGIFDGTVGSLVSDHVPFFPKEGVDLWREKPGIASFPWELPLLLHEGVHNRGLPLPQLVRLNSYGPARRFGLYPRKGAIAVGSDADPVVVDLDEERPGVHDGKGTCIYQGWKLRGWPVLTISRGRVVYADGQVDPESVGHGRCVNRCRTHEQEVSDDTDNRARSDLLPHCGGSGGGSTGEAGVHSGVRPRW
ncbi:MAG: amidohydrolase family protein [Haloechinothrix sp.]